jgi:hypothetical protein
MDAAGRLRLVCSVRTARLGWLGIARRQSRTQSAPGLSARTCPHRGSLQWPVLPAGAIFFSQQPQSPACPSRSSDRAGGARLTEGPVRSHAKGISPRTPMSLGSVPSDALRSRNRKGDGGSCARARFSAAASREEASRQIMCRRAEALGTPERKFRSSALQTSANHAKVPYESLSIMNFSYGKFVFLTSRHRRIPRALWLAVAARPSRRCSRA